MKVLGMILSTNYTENWCNWFNDWCENINTEYKHKNGCECCKYCEKIGIVLRKGETKMTLKTIK